VQFCDALPRSPLGKVLRSRLDDPGDYPAGVGRTDFERGWSAVMEQDQARQLEFLAARVQEQVALTLRRGPVTVGRSASFRDLGFDSLLSAELHLRLRKLTGLPLSITLLWNHPTVDECAAALSAQLDAVSAGRPEPPAAGEPVLPAPADFDNLLRSVTSLSDADVDASLRGR
jgi:acyl carrier protein